MFFHVSWQNFAEDFCCRQDETELLDRYCPSSSTENSSDSQFVVLTNLHLFIMAYLLFVSVPSVFKNRENYPPKYAHDVAVGPAAHLLDMVISCFSAKLGCQENYVRSKRETSAL